jgi:hypothetical protein
MRIYHGKRNPGLPTEPGAVTVTCKPIIMINGDGGDTGYAEPLNPRTDLARHSDRFNWGYYGSGPGQLAVAILAHAVNDGFAVAFGPAFKDDVISKLDDEWTLTNHHVVAWINRRIWNSARWAEAERLMWPNDTPSKQTHGEHHD